MDELELLIFQKYELHIVGTTNLIVNGLKSFVMLEEVLEVENAANE
jgi:hypothetical protein